MHKSSPGSWCRNIAVLLIVAPMVAGCAQTKDWLSKMRTPSPEDANANASTIVGTPEANHYLQEMYQLTGGDPATQAEIYADAESVAMLTPNPSSKLRFGLVLATPGHPGNDPQQAESLLRELLAQRELLTPAEISLATIHLNVVEQQIVLSTETQRLRAENSRAARTEEKAIAQRIATVESENRELRQSLEDAEKKLEAITSIERSIREQADDGEL
jgi:hypothetical protein